MNIVSQKKNVWTYTYEGFSLQIVQEERKNKPIFWFVVNRNAISFVSNKDTAVRLGVNFIDVVKSKEHGAMRQIFVDSAHRNKMKAGWARKLKNEKG